jgi:hypothetical protein
VDRQRLSGSIDWHESKSGYPINFIGIKIA